MAATAEDPFAGVVAAQMKGSMPAGEPIARLTPAAAVSSSRSAPAQSAPKHATHGIAPSPSAVSAKMAAHAHALHMSGAFDTEEFKRRAADLNARVNARTAIVAKQFHALKRMQLEIGALHGPQKHSVEEMRKHLSELSAEVEAARQAFEAAKKAKLTAEDKVVELTDMKEALIERLTEIVAKNEEAKVKKIEELMGNLENLDADALAADPVVMARTAAAAAEAVRRGGTAASSSAAPTGREQQEAARTQATKAAAAVEESAPAFEGF